MNEGQEGSHPSMSSPCGTAAEQAHRAISLLQMAFARFDDCLIELDPQQRVDAVNVMSQRVRAVLTRTQEDLGVRGSDAVACASESTDSPEAELGSGI